MTIIDQIKEPNKMTTLSPEQVEPEVKAPIIPTKIHVIENSIYIKAHLPSLNKNNTIKEYLEQPQSQIISAQISKVVELTPAEYERFLQSLLDNQEWLTEKESNSSHYESKYGEDWLALTNDNLEMKRWMIESYTICLLVTNGTDYILIDPQGYSYARYVAFGIDTTLSEVLELAQIQLLSASVLPIAPETDKEKCVRVAKEIWPAMFESKPATTPAPHLFKVGDRIQHNDKGTARIIWVGTQEIKVENNNDELFLLKIKTFQKKGWEIIETTTKPVKLTAPVQTEILESEAEIIKSDLIETPKVTTPIAPATPETNLIAFPLPKQTESQPVAQPQSNDSDSFYLQNYQTWVNKLVARGEYGKIKSYEEWYAIAVEVM